MVLSGADDSSTVSRSAVNTFFAKVDVAGEGRIAWHQLASFLHLTLVENDEAAARARRVEFHLPARRAPSPHVADSVVKCAIVPKGGLWSLSASGTLATWPAHAGDGAMTPLSSSTLEIGKQATGLEKAANAWATDFAVLPEMAKMAVATGERRIYFCTLGGDFMTQFIVGDLPGVPMRLCTHFSQDLDSTLVLFGDSEGAMQAPRKVARTTDSHPCAHYTLHLAHCNITNVHSSWFRTHPHSIYIRLTSFLRRRVGHASISTILLAVTAFPRAQRQERCSAGHSGEQVAD